MGIEILVTFTIASFLIGFALGYEFRKEKVNISGTVDNSELLKELEENNPPKSFVKNAAGLEEKVKNIPPPPKPPKTVKKREWEG